MTTVVLQNVGAAIGGAVAGPLGAALGRAAGALAGSAVDQQLFGKDRIIEGPRLDATRVLTSTEGASIPMVYGRNRVSGQVIWATRFEERTSVSGGGKGTSSAPARREYSYFANLAIGLCEGSVSCLRRVWADGKEVDLTKLEYRFYNGSNDQEPDPLIEAKQGLGNAPAYRGTAYIVFESLPLVPYGNRVPQLSFEIVRAVGKLEKDIRSITVIPGSTEYGYSPGFVGSGGGETIFNAHNRHNYLADSDWKASMDELQAVCPNLESVSLVVAWFGTDLRAGECQVHPGVTTHFGATWSVAGRLRHQAHLVSQIDGRGAYGGTPSDKSVKDAIADLKARGLRVVIYPFLMMDVPSDNALPSPDGGPSQPAYPWRGEITCHPAPDISNTPDQTSAARSQIETFLSQPDGSYRSMILHYAQLCVEAGGVDGFLIGSEMRGLTKVRDENGDFPFVDGLVDLASDAKQVLGQGCWISYAADWSEYFGYHPQDGSGDALFNLDPLWASAAVDAVAIDNYMPLSDWRDAGDPDHDARSPYDAEYLKSNVAGGEGFDWYYATSADRENGVRSPITDGMGEPWLFRYKDLRSWWENPHHNRVGGVRSPTSTAWQPQSKPYYFTEVGCPAVDKGGNQPNVFYDPKSVQSALPYFSSGGRDDLMQRRFLEAHFAYWNDATNNPISSVYGASMVCVAEMAPWSWDARPFPWFPLSIDVWSDGENWHRGHWLNGRLGGCSLQDLIVQVLHDFGYEQAAIEVDGYVDGFIIPAQASARATLEPLLQLFNVVVAEEEGTLVFRDISYGLQTSLPENELLQEEDEPRKILRRAAELELPGEAVINHASVFTDYEAVATKSGRLEGGSDRQVTLSMPITMQEAAASDVAERFLRNAWLSRDECQVSLPPKYLSVTIGDRIGFDDSVSGEWLVETIETGTRQDLTLRKIYSFPHTVSNSPTRSFGFEHAVIYGAPEATLLDLPLLKEADQDRMLMQVAVSAIPWAQSYAIYSSPAQDGFVYRDNISQIATTGRLLEPVEAGPVGRWDQASRIKVSLNAGNLQSMDNISVLNGGNLALLETTDGGFELFQFSSATLQPDGTWVLTGLLRAGFGSDEAMASGAASGARFILLNEAVRSIELDASEAGVEQNWRVGPEGDAASAPSFASVVYTHGNRSSKMFSPVHLKISEEGSTLNASWIRRGRIGSDNWDSAEIPLDASAEGYRVNIKTTGGSIVRTIDVTEPFYLYPENDRLNDLGAADTPFSFEVAQIGDDGLPGSWASLNYPAP